MCEVGSREEAPISTDSMVRRFASGGGSMCWLTSAACSVGGRHMTLNLGRLQDFQTRGFAIIYLDMLHIYMIRHNRP